MDDPVPFPDSVDTSRPNLKAEEAEPALSELFAATEIYTDDPHLSDHDSVASAGKAEELGGEMQFKADDEGQAITSRTTKVKIVKHEPILWNHVPSAREEAALAFQELEVCTYQSKDYGETGQEEMMSCDCKPDIAEDGENYACGEDSNCINRLTSIECTDDECNCGTRCANQRFQLREYAGVDVFHAGKKGYGLRALVDLHKDMFVYEYIGEVIGEKRFRQRQIDYEQQGEKHFYFMMLQKGEYIDATKKGGFGRFINHSCEPNCYVDKWVVGSKLRMGIFTKRAILTGEELTFDYNVDRYGGEATPCYCGEPTCIGYIGGKTQTEAANRLPQNVVEALGLDDDNDWDDVKPKNRRRKKGQDDEEYVNELSPRGIQEKDVPKIMATLLQTTERWLLKKLLERIQNDGDEKIQTKIVALHGYQTLGSKLEKWKHDAEISILILRILQKWPSMTKNKISSSKIETHVSALVSAPDTIAEVKEMSTCLLGIWSNLEMAYRIPRRVRPVKVETHEQSNDTSSTGPKEKSPKPDTNGNTALDDVARRNARNPSYRQDQPWRRQEHNYKSRDSSRHFSSTSALQNRFANNSKPSTPVVTTPVKIDPINHDLQAIIDAATKKQQEQAAALKIQEETRAAEEAERLKLEAKKRADRARRHEEHKLEKEKRASAKRHKDHAKHASGTSQKPSSDSDKSRAPSLHADDEKHLTTTFARYVANTSAKYQERLGREQFKRRVKEIVRILVAKEMKKETRELSELSESKKAKIKAFSRDFMDRVLARQSSRDGPATNPDQGTDEDSLSSGDDVDHSSPPTPVNKDLSIQSPGNSLPHVGKATNGTETSDPSNPEQAEPSMETNSSFNGLKRAIEDGSTEFDTVKIQRMM